MGTSSESSYNYLIFFFNMSSNFFVFQTHLQTNVNWWKCWNLFHPLHFNKIVNQTPHYHMFSIQIEYNIFLICLCFFTSSSKHIKSKELKRVMHIFSAYSKMIRLFNIGSYIAYGHCRNVKEKRREIRERPLHFMTFWKRP